MGRTGLMASTTTSAASSDLARHHLLPPLSPVDGGRGLGSMNMDDLLQNMYAAESPTVVNPISREVAKSVDEVWKEISGERKMGGGGAAEAAAMGYSTEMTMTLEDYLARAGVVGEGEVGGMVVQQQQQQQGVLDSGIMGVVMDYGQPQRQQKVEVERAFMGYGNGGTEGGGGGGGRGRRRVVQDQADKVAQQKQRRMIKNRESAARSRERKQAHTVELESLVAQLEEENSALKQQQEEQRRKRLKQLLETRIPTVERKKPQRHLRKTLSMQ